MSLHPYSQYKESGVSWLGEVPQQWGTPPSRAIVSEVDRRNQGALCQDYLSLMANVGVIPYEEKGDIGNKKPDDLAKCKHVRIGNLVINSMNYGIGSYGMSKYEGVCSPVYIVLNIHEEVVLPRFALRIFESTAFQRFAASLGNGILAHRAAIGWGDLKSIGVPLPPKADQAAILDFLDRETAKIDALVEEQRRLIELLKEKRQAVISHAVTKGLDPNAPMKDSGVEWLGLTPEPWIVLVAKRVSSVFVPQRNKPELNMVAEGTPWVTMEQMSLAEVSQSNFWVSAEAAQIAGTRTLLAGAVLASCVGNFGAASINTLDIVINQQLQAFIPGSQINAKFLRFCVVNAKEYFEQVSTASTLTYVNQEGFRNMPLALPTLQEQEGIVAFLNIVGKRIFELVAGADRVITLLQERRSALISAAVTGKIDVRNYAPDHFDTAQEAHAPA